jgi:hypothetical protein
MWTVCNRRSVSSLHYNYDLICFLGRCEPVTGRPNCTAASHVLWRTSSGCTALDPIGAPSPPEIPSTRTCVYVLMWSPLWENGTFGLFPSQSSKKVFSLPSFFFYRFLCHCREHLKKFLNNSSEFLIMPDYMISKGIRGSTQTEQKCPFVFGWSELG